MDGNSRSSRAAFCLAVSDHAGNDEIWVIHYSAERDCQGVSEFASFMDGAGGLGIDMAGDMSVNTWLYQYVD